MFVKVDVINSWHLRFSPRTDWLPTQQQARSFERSRVKISKQVPHGPPQSRSFILPGAESQTSDEQR